MTDDQDLSDTDRRFLEGLAHLPPEPPPAGLTELFRQRMQGELSAAPRWRPLILAGLAAALLLALGIGSTVTVFTLVNGMLLRPLPYPNQEQIVYVEEVANAVGIDRAVAYPNYLDFAARNRSLSDIALFGSGRATLRGDTRRRHPSG